MLQVGGCRHTVSVPERGFVALIRAVATTMRAQLHSELHSFSPRAGIRGFDTHGGTDLIRVSNPPVRFSPRAGIRGFDTDWQTRLGRIAVSCVFQSPSGDSWL